MTSISIVPPNNAEMEFKSYVYESSSNTSDGSETSYEKSEYLKREINLSSLRNNIKDKLESQIQQIARKSKKMKKS